MRRSHIPLLTSAVVGAAMAAVMSSSLSGCTIPVNDSARNAQETTVSTTATTSVPNSQTATAKPDSGKDRGPKNDKASQVMLQAALDQAIADATAQFGGSAGISISDGRTTVSSGTFTVGPAWSTIKVPLALAAVKAGVANPDSVTSALEFSDNAAAEQLWQALGGGQAAANAVQQEIGQVSIAPAVPAEVTRPGFSAFGQAQWPLDDQAAFGAKVRCVDTTGEIGQHMAQVVGGQRYGLGQIADARFKGGWGPDQSGAYLTRQFGAVEVHGKNVGIAVAAQPADGSYESGQAMLSAIASQVTASEAWRHLALGAGDC